MSILLEKEVDFLLAEAVSDKAIEGNLELSTQTEISTYLKFARIDYISMLIFDMSRLKTDIIEKLDSNIKAELAKLPAQDFSVALAKCVASIPTEDYLSYPYDLSKYSGCNDVVLGMEIRTNITNNAIDTLFPEHTSLYNMVINVIGTVKNAFHNAYDSAFPHDEV
jgi:hypothetical protein